jgi:hypothetical protein
MPELNQLPPGTVATRNDGGADDRPLFALRTCGDLTEACDEFGSWLPLGNAQHLWSLVPAPVIVTAPAGLRHHGEPVLAVRTHGEHADVDVLTAAGWLVAGA